MALPIGVRVGPYEIVGAVGAGGMGEVYRARDARLGRDVAIKILPDAVARDPDRRARFEREARSLAALNHANIATIHGVEESAAGPALIMELVEGETLADRLLRGPLAVAEALAQARQLAAAIEAAHAKGIVHRDLKPANIKVTPAGTVKVLDFGLAKAIASSTTDPEGAHAATTIEGTHEGVVVGTAAYMSPEQAIGQPVDTRTDIWAFGCVVYEMFTGRQAFEGRTASEAVAAVLKADPDWHRLPGDTPDAVRRLLHRCLRKEASSRLRDIGDASLELDDAEAPAPQSSRAAPPRRRWLPWAAALAVVAAAIGAALRRPTVAPDEIRLELTTLPTSDPSVAISPDGRTLAFVGLTEGRRRLWLRRFDATDARAVPGSDNAGAPFWSPDGRAIGFFASGRVNLASLDDGSVRALATGLASPSGATLNGAGVLLYSANPGAPLWRVSTPGEAPTAATKFETEHRLHAFPSFLPDGRHFLFFVASPAEARGTHLGQLDHLESRRLLDSEGPAVFAAASNCLFFVRDGKLFAQRFDPGRLALGSDAITIDEHAPGGTALAASAAGAVVYRTPKTLGEQRQLVWLDRTGAETHRVVYTDTMSFGPALSRDGRRVAVFRNTGGNVDLWTYDVPRGTWDRVTFDAGDDIFPLWSSDGRRLIFASRRGTMDLYSIGLGGGPESERLELSTPEPKFPTDWSPDDRMVLFNTIGAASGVDIAALPVGGTHQPLDVVKTPANEQHAQFSPDGRWIAYQSDKTGRFEIYVRPFPGPGADVPVSTDGGAQARWNPRGDELFYVAADDRLMAVRMAFERPEIADPGSPTALFVTTVGTTAPNTNRHQYSVAPDGRTFLMNSVVEPANVSPVMVLLNWRPPR